MPRGSLVLLGDHHAVSFDSRRVGYFPADRVLGTVLRRLPPGTGGGGRSGGCPYG
ncbi:S26 family signal peptidase [Streptomyces sp. NPDC051219]|uniref:S26 family signal peptidase n=1 Tax=Streptomyces sp. NPDC051219 TaxID=3155283 RepID=UPI0034406BC6